MMGVQYLLVLSLLPLIFVGYVSAGSIYLAIRKTEQEGVCSIDSDCPQGYICIDGKCQPA